MTDIPTSLEGLTADWLTEQLGAAGHDVPAVADLEVEPMDGFVGALGEVGIVRVGWDGAAGDTPLPASFVAKCPLDDDMARLYNSVMQFYVREAGFYRDLVHDVDMRIPTCWVNRFDAESGSAFLLLDHVTEVEKGDILAGTSVETMRELVGDLARMHGMFWMDQRLLDVPWLMDWNAENLKLGIEITQQCWAALHEAEPDRYPAELRDVLQRTWIDDTVTWLEAFTARPWTLTHIDYELDNVLIGADGPIILDWQSTMRSHPAVDLGWLLAASHNDETLAAEPQLLDHYRTELSAAGGPAWSADELEAELAFGMLYPASCQPVPYLQDTGDGPAGQRMHRRFDKMLEGSIDAAQRWNLVDHVGKLL